MLTFFDEILNRISTNIDQSLSNEGDFANRILESKDMANNLDKYRPYDAFDYEKSILSKDITKSLNKLGYTNTYIDGIEASKAGQAGQGFSVVALMRLGSLQVGLRKHHMQ